MQTKSKNFVARRTLSNVFNKFDWGSNASCKVAMRTCLLTFWLSSPLFSLTFILILLLLLLLLFCYAFLWLLLCLSWIVSHMTISNSQSTRRNQKWRVAWNTRLVPLASQLGMHQIFLGSWSFRYKFFSTYLFRDQTNSWFFSQLC